MIAIKAHFISFGCKVNLYETENMKTHFAAEGFDILSDEQDADLYVINTCTVTSMSDKKIRQTLHRLRKENPSSILALTGCFPQAFEEEASRLEEADIITGAKDRSTLVSTVKEFLLDRQRIIRVSPHLTGEPFEKMTNTAFPEKTRAFVKIQDGCDQFCSYCIIPTARGRIRSKPMKDLKQEVTALAQAGHKEIVLVGINLSFYGKEFGLRLADAIELCCSADGVERVRLGSLEPEVISDEDIAHMARLDKLCPQFHLSLQSGCDRTLKAMNRKYTSEGYFSLVTRLRDAFPDCAVTTDIMVGFPGETEADFEESLAFVQKVGFSKVHVFPYSRREGTPAAQRSDQVSSTVKTLRAKRMGQIATVSQHKFLQQQIGKTVPVLFERENCTDFHQGYAPNYTLVKIPSKMGENSLRRQIFYVKIKSIHHDFCMGEIQNEI